MVATDTVVGIIGAVVLVAVMAGVFVYEYNNAPGADADSEAMEHFELDYAGMAATQDIDGDGTANWQDDDIDGDEVPNEEDTETTKVEGVNANVPAPSPTGGGAGTYTQSFTVLNGSIHLQGSLTYTRAAGGAVPNIQGTLSGPDGFDTITISFAASGNTYTATISSEEPPAGEYTLTLTNQPAGGVVPIGQAGTVTGSLLVHYPALSEDHGH